MPFHAIEAHGIGPGLQGRRIGVLQAHAAQAQPAGGHGIGGVHIAPLDQRGQHAVQQPLAVAPHADAPLQQTRGGHARGLQCRATVPAVRRAAGQGAVQPVGARHPVQQLRAIVLHFLHERRIVHVEPAAQRRLAQGAGTWLDGNDFQIGPLEIRAVDAQQAVVRAHQRVLSAGTGCHAQRALAPGHARLQRGGDDHQVVQRGVHSWTVPWMQATTSPPIQTWPASSRWTKTSPARPSAVPWRAR